MTHLNRVCNLEEFEDPTRAHRKNWEIEQAVSLMTGQIRRKTARVLGVGAGKESTIFQMTNYAEVHATDMYAGAGGWAGDAPAQMLIDPGQFAPSDLDWQPEQLIVQHMDGRALRYPDDHFDAVFSSSSIEHFGTLDEISTAMREIARVVRPGGVVTLATEYKIDGPAGIGWKNVVLFDEAMLHDVVITPSGLELMDDLDLSVSEATLATASNLVDAIVRHRRGQPPVLPHVVVTHEGYTFTSVHLALKKTK